MSPFTGENTPAELREGAAAGNMRDAQRLEVMRQQKILKKLRKGPAVSKADLQRTTQVAQGVGEAGAQAFLQGSEGLNPAAIKAAQEGAADVTAQTTAAGLDAIQKVKESQKARAMQMIAQGGESHWKQQMATWELALKGATAGLAAI